MVDPRSARDCSFPAQSTTEETFADFGELSRVERRTTMVDPGSARDPVCHGGPAPERTEAKGDSSVVRRPLSVVAEEKQDEAERGAGDGAVQSPQDAAASVHERLARVLRTEANSDSSVVRRPLSVVAEKGQEQAERATGDRGVASPEDAAASVHERPGGVLRTEANADSSVVRRPLSVVAGEKRDDPPAPVPTVAVAEGSGPYDVRNRRYFGAQMSAARIGSAGSQRTSRTNQRRSGSRKPAKTRKRD
jgi:hypothetical protein